MRSRGWVAAKLISSKLMGECGMIQDVHARVATYGGCDLVLQVVECHDVQIYPVPSDCIQTQVGETGLCIRSV